MPKFSGFFLLLCSLTIHVVNAQTGKVRTGDSVKIKIEKIVRDVAVNYKCRMILKARLADGSSLYSGFDGRTGKPVTDFSQPVEIGSCSKMLTAAAIHQLIEKKKLSLDTKLLDLFPDRTMFGKMLVIDSVDYLDSVLVRNLLNHTSGFADYFMKDVDKELAVHGDSTLRFTPWQLIRLSARLYPAQFKINERFGYSNVNYILLGLIIEKLSGMKYQQYIQKNILDPMGLKQAWFGSVNPPANRAKGYMKGKPSQIPATFAWSAGEMLMTVDGMLSFINAWYRGRVYRDPGTINWQLREGYNSMGLGIRYGLGVINLQSTSWGHSGETFGSSSYMGACENGARFAFAIDDADVTNWTPAFEISALLSAKKPVTN